MSVVGKCEFMSAGGSVKDRIAKVGLPYYVFSVMQLIDP